jgi:hypothetical protein
LHFSATQKGNDFSKAVNQQFSMIFIFPSHQNYIFSSEGKKYNKVKKNTSVAWREKEIKRIWFVCFFLNKIIFFFALSLRPKI